MIGLSIVSAEMFGCLLSIALPFNVSCEIMFNAERTRVAVLWIYSVSIIKNHQSWQERAAASIVMVFSTLVITVVV